MFVFFFLEHFVHFEFEFFFTRSWPSMKTRKILGIFVKKLTNPTRDTGTRRHWNTHGTHSLEHFQILLGKIFFFFGRATQFNTRRRRHSLGADTQTTGGSSFAAGRFVVRTTHKTDRSHAPCHQWQPSVLFHLPAHRGGYFGCDFIGRLINQMPLIGARFKGSNLHTFAYICIMRMWRRLMTTTLGLWISWIICHWSDNLTAECD